MQVISNSFPFPPLPSATPAIPKRTPVGRFLDKLAREHLVEDVDGAVDYAAELTVRAIAAAAATWSYRSRCEVQGVLAVLADQVNIYMISARCMQQHATGNDTYIEDLAIRASAFAHAAEQLIAASKAIGVEFAEWL